MSLNPVLATSSRPQGAQPVLSVGRAAKLQRVVRFAASGTAAALVNLLLLWLLTAKLGIWYLEASVLAFSTALMGNFLCQKIWAFGSSQIAHVHAQLLQFVAINLLNLVLNTAILYLLVGRLGVPYLAGQIISSGIIAAESYWAYGWIFQRRISGLLHQLR